MQENEIDSFDSRITKIITRTIKYIAVSTISLSFSNGFKIRYNIWQNRVFLISVPYLKYVIIPSVLRKYGITFTINEISYERISFGKYSSLLSFDYNSEVTEINQGFFLNFKHVVLPKSMIAIKKCESHPFKYLFDAVIDPENKYFHNESNIFIQNFPQKIIRCSPKARRSFIREGITRIGNDSFSYCKFIRSIRIPSSVKTIESKAFYRCYNLESVTFAQNSKLTHIEEYSFVYTRLKKIVIPSSIEVIREGSFVYCPYLKTIQIADRNNNLHELDNNIIYGRLIEKKTYMNVCEFIFAAISLKPLDTWDLNSLIVRFVNFPHKIIEYYKIDESWYIKCENIRM